MRAARPCLQPGCPTLVRNAIRCATHQQQWATKHDAADRIRRGSARDRGYDGTWERVRRMKLRANPLCERCGAEGITRTADLVHHVVPLNDGGARLDMANLKSVCTPCHALEHVELAR